MATMRQLIEGLRGLLGEERKWLKTSGGHELQPGVETRAMDLRKRMQGIKDAKTRERASDVLSIRLRSMEKKPAAERHAFLDNVERIYSSQLSDQGFRGDEDAIKRSKAKDGPDSFLDVRTGKHMTQKQLDRRDGNEKAAKKRQATGAGGSTASAEKAVAGGRAREMMAGGGIFQGKKIFPNVASRGSGYQAEPTPRRKGKSVGGDATMPGPGGDVAGKWVTVKGKRLFFPDKPGGDVPEGPWGGAPFRPGWTGRGGKFRAARGVMPQKGQLGLFGKKRRHEGRTYTGRPLSEQLGAFLGEYRTKGWSNVPDKSKKVWKVTPPGKKGVWRTLKNGRHVFFPQDGSGPIGGHPGHAGWAKGSGKFRAGPKKGAKQAKETKRGTR